MDEPEIVIIDEAWIIKHAAYICHRAAILDRDLLTYGDPKGKDVLVFGCGLGTEVLWCARRGARSIVGIDLNPAVTAALEHVLRAEALNPDYEMRQEDVYDTALRGRRFDLIISNGVFEHVMDLKGTLNAFRDLLTHGGRIAIFADGLFYSSMGGHIESVPWDHPWRHLLKSTSDIKAEYPTRWKVWRQKLNRMTTVDFLEALRAVGLLVLQFRLGRDPHLRKLPALIDQIRSNVYASPTDMSIISIGCELTFIENL